MNAVHVGDTQLFLWINHMPHVWWSDYLAEACSGFGYAWMLWFFIGLFLFIHKEKKDHWFWVPLGIAAGCCYLLSEIMLKYMIARPRPDILESAIIVGSIPSSFSFPSSHVAFAFAFAYLFSRKELHWGWVYGLAFLVCFSRVYMGHHYPLDVVGGIMLGTLIGWVSLRVSDMLRKQARHFFSVSKKKRKKV